MYTPMKATGSSETPVLFYQTARHHIADGRKPDIAADRVDLLRLQEGPSSNLK
jgi:hypothetical protein